MATSSMPGSIADAARSALETGTGTARAAVALARSGVVRPVRPERLYGMGRALVRYGYSVTAGFAVGAARHPYRLAVVDDDGVLTYAELDEQTDRIAAGLLATGAAPGGAVGILCRNHRAPVEVMVAAGKAGADVVLLNTGLSAEQLRAVAEQQDLHTIVADPEFADLVPDPSDGSGPWLVRTGGDGPGTLAALAAHGSPDALPFRPERSRMIVLTSGTTGTPKGAKRPHPSSLAPAASILSAIPLRAGEPVLISAPLFHTWGNAALLLCALHGSTVVLQRAFEPQAFLDVVERRRTTTIFAVPVMLQRVLEHRGAGQDNTEHRGAGQDNTEHRGAGSDEADGWVGPHRPRIVAVSGSALPAGQATEFMDRFGDCLYNLYGSTEVSWVSIANPGDLRAAPGTAGRAPAGTTLLILGDDDRPVEAGVEGRVFVGNDLPFDGYTGAESSLEERDGLLGTGDVGRLDSEGRLHLTGRADDMIVSGGENVHPGPVEELIANSDGVCEVAVLGVPDQKFGQRLAAYVVRTDGATLTENDVRDLVRGQLAKFAVPRDVHFLDRLPRNQTGKVLRTELPDAPSG